MPDSPLQAAPTGQPSDAVRDQDKIMLVLAYLGLLSLIPLLTVKDSDYVKWHAKQGLALCLCWLGASIALGMIPFLGWMLEPFVTLGGFVLVILGIVKAMNGQRWRIPLVASLADKF